MLFAGWLDFLLCTSNKITLLNHVLLPTFLDFKRVVDTSSRDCSTEVQPPGIMMTVVFQWVKIAWISSVTCVPKLLSISSDGRFVLCPHPCDP